MSNEETGFLREKEKLYFWEKPAARQTFVTVGLMSLIFSTGVFMGSSTVMLPQLKDNGEIIVSDTMAAWIYSVNGFGSVPTGLVVPYLSQWKGYKFVFVVICLPMIIACILQFFATSAVHLLIAAICQGVTMGGNFSLGIIAITEYAEPRLRGSFLVMKSASFFWGIWIANIIGTFSYWRYISLFGLWPALFSLASCFVWPEGPYWLASKGKIEECRTSFEWLRGPGKGAEELSSIIKNQPSIKRQDHSDKRNLLTRMKEAVVLRQFYMPLVVNCVSYCLYQFTGKLVVTIYVLVILEDITKNMATAYTGMIVIDGVTVIGMYIGSYVAMKVRRQAMYLSTTAVTILSLYVLFVYLSLVEYNVVSQNTIVSLTLLVMYSFAVSWGPMVLATSYTSEISPMRFKNFIVSVGSCVYYGIWTVNLRMAPVLKSSVGMHGTFGIYATLTLICWIFLYKYLPETNNKTLQELELCFVQDANTSNKSEINER